MRTLRLRVGLRDVEPAVVRVIDVPAVITLDELHDVLQVALGWADSHLHAYRADTTTYRVPDPDNDVEFDEQDERGVLLTRLPASFGYFYDFGDGWVHDVEVLGPGGDEPGCCYGEGACPPEDCGGPGGYADLLAALSDPRNPKYRAAKEWVGDRLRPFDQEAAALRVQEMVGLVPGSVRLVLDLIADGIKLTPGGRLPRSVVRAVQAERPTWYRGPLGHLASTEDDLPELGALHDVLRQVGLARLANGVLRPTVAARDGRNVVRRLRNWFPPREFGTELAETAVAVLVALGPLPSKTLAAAVLPHLAIGWRHGEDPVSTEDVETVLYQMWVVLAALDLVELDWSTWSPGPSARTLLPRATGLVAFV